MQWQSFLQAVHRKYAPRDIVGEKGELIIVSSIINDRSIGELLSAWLEDRSNHKILKCHQTAKRLKDEGNVAFKNENYLISVDLYTKSARHAASENGDFAISLANRAAAFFHLQEYDKCLEDIAVAFDSNYPRKLHYKLHLRAAQCHLKLYDAKRAQEECEKSKELIKCHENLLEKVRANLLQQISDIEDHVSRLRNNSEIKSTKNTSSPVDLLESNPKFSHASSKLSREYSPTRGRYVVATTAVKRGDLLLVEKPFAFVPLDHATSNSVCAHCCRLVSNAIIPCRGCVNVFYCSKKCWNESWMFYHQWECTGYELDIWRQIGIAHLALRLFLVSCTTSDRGRFNEVQNLITNFEEMSTDDLIVYSITASMLTMYLDKYTNFFNVIDLKACLVDKFIDDKLDIFCDISSHDGKKLFVGTLLLRHMLQLIANGHAITRLNLTTEEVGENIIEEQQQRVAVGIYPSASMMNHSCDPTIMNTFWDDYLIVKAVKDVPVGGEIFNCYGPHYRRMDLEQRQMALKSQYFFICKCPACTEPSLQIYLNRFHALKCLKCEGPLQQTSRDLPTCLDCKTVSKIDVKLSKVELCEAEALFNSAQSNLQLNKNEDALIDLKRCLTIRQKWLYKCHDDLTLTLDALGKVSINIGNWLDSISYLEQTIFIVGVKFGADSIEVANELNKMTDVCIKYLQQEIHRVPSKIKRISKKTQLYLEQAEKIVNVISGPWNNINQEIIDKKNILAELQKNLV